MATLPKFLKQDKDSILFNGDGEFYFYIPEKFFELDVAIYVGEYISTLGIMTYAYKDGGKTIGPKQFDYPTRFLTKPYKVNKLKGVRLTKEDKKQDYRVLCYKKGDELIHEIRVPEAIENVESFIKLFVIGGYIPNTIPYDKLQNYFIDNIAYNGYNYNISLQMLGIVISEICRDSKDIDRPFRLAKTTDMNAYTPLGVKTVARMVSSYSAITSENFDESIVFAALNKDKNVPIPLERVLTGEDIT